METWLVLMLRFVELMILLPWVGFFFWIEAVPQTTDDPRKKDLNHLLTLVLGTWGFALDTCIVTTQPGSYGLFPQQGME
jgi:hypothetical protein